MLKFLDSSFIEFVREKIAMENLKNQMDQEKQYQLDRKNRIKQAQYEDYNNYLRQKYSTPPQFREQLNIKLGGEQRNIKKMNYNEEIAKLKEEIKELEQKLEILIGEEKFDECDITNNKIEELNSKLKKLEE